MPAVTGFAVPVRDLMSRLRASAPTLLDPAWMRETWSGTYGAEALTVTPDSVSSSLRFGESWLSGHAKLDGTIHLRDNHAGSLVRQLTIDRDGVASIRHEHLKLMTDRQRKGFATAFNARAEQRYALAGANQVTLGADKDGGYVWARRGYELVADSDAHRARLVARLVERARRRLTPEELAQLEPHLDSLTGVRELASIPEVGPRVLLGQTWEGSKLVTPVAPWYGPHASATDMSAALRSQLPSALDPGAVRAAVESTNAAGGLRLVGDVDESFVLARLADDDAAALRAEHHFDVVDERGTRLGSATADIRFKDDGSLSKRVSVRSSGDRDTSGVANQLAAALER